MGRFQTSIILLSTFLTDRTETLLAQVGALGQSVGSEPEPGEDPVDFEELAAAASATTEELRKGAQAMLDALEYISQLIGAAEQADQIYTELETKISALPANGDA